MALCTYVRCSHDSKSSPHPPSSICLARRNRQAWTTSWHAALWDGVEDQAELGTGSICTPMCNQLLPAAVLCPTHGQDCSERSGLRIWKEQYVGQGARVQGVHPAPPQTTAPAQEGGRGGATGQPLLTRHDTRAACWRTPPDRTRYHR